MDHVPPLVDGLVEEISSLESWQFHRGLADLGNVNPSMTSQMGIDACMTSMFSGDDDL